MRKLALATTAAVAIFAAGSLSASALTIGGPAGVRAAIETINPVDNVACWWNGWRWVCYHRYHYWRWRYRHRHYY
jgi:hypothetical protein